LWFELLAELRRRGGGYREAGAFLLGTRSETGERTVSAFILYDDVDPDALRGFILFDGSKMDRVWDRCAKLGMQVVADVHTHPGGHGQSSTDQENPMIPERGHLALIVPNFADRNYRPGEIGIFEFRGRDGWVDHSTSGQKLFRLRWWR
jgi:proteasome lid subunit RPN8/RPN11